MASSKLPEVWLRGPLPGIPPLLQPVAHALLQAREEVNELMKNFPETSLWHKPYDVASVGFHLQHLSGVIDRLFTYARAQSLNKEQLSRLQAEGQITEAGSAQLVQAFNQQVDIAIEQLRNTSEDMLTAYRAVGRA